MTDLSGMTVAVSISDAPDRARLGYPQREIDRAVLSVCTALVRAGADIAYGGNLDPDGYTFKIFRHLAGAYAGSRETPFHHFVPEPVARVIRYEDLLATLQEGRSTARTEIARGDAFIPARPGGRGIRLGDAVVRDDTELAAWFDEAPRPDNAAAHTAARRMVTMRSDARVVLGGKMGVLSDPKDAYQGAMPGVAEEAVMTLEEGKPLVPLGAFGGTARDIAIAMELMSPDAMVPRGEQHAGYHKAIERVVALRDRVPSTLRGRLADVAEDDRAEQTAYHVAEIVGVWAGTGARATA